MCASKHNSCVHIVHMRTAAPPHEIDETYLAFIKLHHFGFIPLWKRHSAACRRHLSPRKTHNQVFLTHSSSFLAALGTSLQPRAGTTRQSQPRGLVNSPSSPPGMSNPPGRSAPASYGAAFASSFFCGPPSAILFTHLVRLTPELETLSHFSA